MERCRRRTRRARRRAAGRREITSCGATAATARRRARPHLPSGDRRQDDRRAAGGLDGARHRMRQAGARRRHAGARASRWPPATPSRATTARTRWFGTGRAEAGPARASPGRCGCSGSRGWQFKNWYVNLEEPLARWAGGVDSEDHFLDIAVLSGPQLGMAGRGRVRAGAAGRPDGRRSRRERVRAAGRAAVELIGAWGAPFRDGWQDWRPDPAWTVPVASGRTGTVWRDRAPESIVDALGVMNLLLCPRVANVGSSSGTVARAGLSPRAIHGRCA